VKPHRILVPVKGDLIDDEAVQLACTLAAGREQRGKPRTTIEIIYVIEVPRALPLDADLPDEVQRGEKALTHAEGLTHGMNVMVETEILQARTVGAAIVDEAVERGAGTIIMAAQYRRRLGEFNMGLTLPYVLKNAPCRVLITRAPSRVEVGSVAQPQAASTNGQPHT
jgi:nucleotide-binding universal stress UspA family protein